MKLSRKKWSPIFQPYLLASFLPIAAPCRSWRKGCHWSGGTLNSGYMAKYGSASTPMFGKKLDQSVVESDPASALPSFLAGSDPPNQLVVATRFTPGTDWMRLP